jgi:hypothetical protein
MQFVVELLFSHPMTFSLSLLSLQFVIKFLIVQLHWLRLIQLVDDFSS